MKKIIKENKIKELERRITELEKNQTYRHSSFVTQAPLHFHNGIPCYQNPCVWC